MDPFTDPDFSRLAEYLVVSFSALLFALVCTGRDLR